MRDYFHSVERDLFGAEPRPSIPIKPITFKATTLSPARSGSRDVTSREATALATIYLAVQQVEWIIENGCGQDIAQSGLADIEPGACPREDRFILSARFIQWVETAVGQERLDAFMASPVLTHFTPA